MSDQVFSVSFYGIAYMKGSHGPFYKTIGLLKDLEDPEKLKEFEDMLLEDSKKLEAARRNQLKKDELKAFQERKRHLKNDKNIDLDEKPKKKAGRPKGAKNKKEQ